MTMKPLTDVPSLLDWQVLYRALRDIEAIATTPHGVEKPKQALNAIAALAATAIERVRKPEEG